MRSRSQEEVNEAKKKIAADLAVARAEIERQTPALANDIARTILERRPPSARRSAPVRRDSAPTGFFCSLAGCRVSGLFFRVDRRARIRSGKQRPHPRIRRLAGSSAGSISRSYSPRSSIFSPRWRPRCFEADRKRLRRRIAEGARAREAAEKLRREVQAKLAGIDQEVARLREEAKRSTEAEVGSPEGPGPPRSRDHRARRPSGNSGGGTRCGTRN